MNLCQSLREHWPEYLMEAWGLGTFMVSAGIVVVLLESPDSPIHELIRDGNLRRVIVGLSMGLTAIGIIYSPWGKQSGAQINPAITLTFLRLGKMAAWDAWFYIVFQFVGGTLGVLLVWACFGDSFAQPPVAYVVTVPGPEGAWLAFAAETLISMVLMLTVLAFMNAKKLAHYTGLAAGVLVALFITLEAPFSGMSMNPARSFASAAPSGIWTAGWIYFTAPFLGMFSAVELYRLFRFTTQRMCAKLDHPLDRRCIHCGHGIKKDNTNSQQPASNQDAYSRIHYDRTPL